MMATNKQVKEVQKYQAAMREVARRCDDKEQINYRSLQYDFHLQPIAVKAMCNMGHMEKIGYGKYIWKASRVPSPMMARRLYDWMKEYFLATKTRQREMEQEILYNQDTSDTNEPEVESIVDDIEKIEPVFNGDASTDADIEFVPTDTEQPILVSSTTKTIKIFGIKVMQIIKAYEHRDKD